MINLQKIKTGDELIVTRDIITKGIVAGQRAVVTRVDRNLNIPKATIQVLDSDLTKKSKIIRYDEQTINIHFEEVAKMSKENNNIRINVDEVSHLRLKQVRDIYTNGHITVVILNGGYKGKSKCDTEHDEYDRDKGILIAYHRATIKANLRENKKAQNKALAAIESIQEQITAIEKAVKKIITESNTILEDLLK